MSGCEVPEARVYTMRIYSCLKYRNCADESRNGVFVRGPAWNYRIIVIKLVTVSPYYRGAPLKTRVNGEFIDA